jgi:mycothiol synthase
MDTTSLGPLVEIVRPAAPLLEAALRLALRPLTADDRQARVARLQAALTRGAGRDECLSAAAPQQATTHPTAGANGPELFAAVAAGRLVGALWVEPQPGRAVVFSRPQLVEGQGKPTAVALLKAAAEHATLSGAVLLEALLESDASEDLERFVAAGFEHACDLLYLVCQAKVFPSAARVPAPELEFAVVKPADDARLAEIVDRTYEGTLDCPRLNHVRSSEEVLTGYQTVGSFSRERWFIVRSEAHDIGCLLLADHPQTNQWELVYMGLVPEARGRGWGVGITRHAQWLARHAGRERMVLAVDAANAPAVAMYERAGLFAWDRRSVLLRVLTGVA